VTRKHRQRYFERNEKLRLSQTAHTVTLHIPVTDTVGQGTIAYFAACKQAILDQVQGVIRHWSPQVQSPVQLHKHQTRTNLQPGNTYGELRKFLARHGFEQVRAAGTHKAFQEHESGALVILPDYQESDEIRPFHLASVTKLLVEHGFMK